MCTSKSSIYRWDFPWNKSSSYWATPILWKPPVVIQESAQTQTLFVIAFIGSLDDLTLFVPMLVGKGCLTMTRAGTGGATGKLHQMLLSCAIDIYIYILMYNIIYIYLHSNIYIYICITLSSLVPFVAQKGWTSLLNFSFLSETRSCFYRGLLLGRNL